MAQPGSRVAVQRPSPPSTRVSTSRSPIPLRGYVGAMAWERPVLGRWFEDLEVGLVIPHALTRTITEADNINFSAATLNPAPLHLDSHYAAETEFGRPLVSSMFTLALVVGISVHETTHGTTVA